MSTTQLQPSDAAVTTEALIREARRRQRRRWVATGLLCLAVASGTWLATASRSGDSGHRAPFARTSSLPTPRGHTAPATSIPRRVDTTLLLWQPGRSYVDDLNAQLVSSTSPILHDIAYGDNQPLASVVGKKIVFVSNGLSVLGDGLTGQPRHLADTARFVPAAHAGQVWLTSGPYGHGRIQLLSIRGGVTGTAIDLPRNTAMIRGTDAGLLLNSSTPSGSQVEIWQSGSAPTALPHAPSWGDGVSATPRLVAYDTGCTFLSPHASYEPDACRMLRVFDVVTGHLASYPAPPGTLGWVPFEFNLVDAITRSGTRLAAEAAIAPRHADRGRLYTMHLDGSNNRPTVVPRSTGSVRARVAWSVRGDWLFYQGPGTRLWGYQPQTGRVRQSDTPCCGYTVMAAVPAGRG